MALNDKIHYEIQPKLLCLFPAQLKPPEVIVPSGFNTLQLGARWLSFYFVVFPLSVLIFHHCCQIREQCTLSCVCCCLLGWGGSGTAGWILSLSATKPCLLRHHSCLWHIQHKPCHCSYVCWIKGRLNAKFWLFTWHSSWYSQGTENGTYAMRTLHFLFVSTGRAGEAALESGPRSQCVALPITETITHQETNNW